MDSNTELVDIYSSKHTDRDILVVNGIPASISDETLENFLEVICQTEVDHLYFHQSIVGTKVQEIAIVILKEKVADLTKTQEKAGKKKIGGKVVYISHLDRPTGIIVYGVSGEATEDEITLYFERKNVAGSDADVEQCILKRDINIAVLLYGHPEKALQNVLKMKHKIRGKDVTVEPYYRNFHEGVIKVLGMDTLYLEACFSETTKSMQDGHGGQTKLKQDEHVGQTKPIQYGYMVQTKPSQDGNVVQKERNLPRPLSESRLRLFSEEMDEYPPDVADEDGYMVPVSTAGNNDNDDIDSMESKDVDRLKDKTFSDSTRSEHIYTEIDDELFKPPIPITPRPTEKRPQVNPTHQSSSQEIVKLKQGQALLLYIKGFEKDCKECQIKLNVAEDSVSFNGPKDVVVATKLQMYECLGSIVEVTKSIMKCQVNVLGSSPDWVTQILKKNRIAAVCTTRDGEIICCQAFTKPVAEEALKTVLSHLDTIEIPYTEANFKFLNSDDWKKTVNRINNRKCVSVEVIRPKKQIVVSGKKGDCQAAREEIKKELGKHLEAKSQKMEIKGGKAVCIHLGHKHEMDRLQNDIRKKNGNLLYKYDKRVISIEIKGNPGAVEDTKTEIELLISSVWQGPVDLQKISNKDKDVAIVSKALDCGRGRYFLSEFENKHRCGVNIEKTKETHQLHHVHSVPAVNQDHHGDLPRRHTVADMEGGARPKDRKPQKGNSWICKTDFRSTEIILKQGNIAFERADVLVNVVADCCKFTTSRIAQNFISNGGPLVERNYTLAREEDEDNCIVITDNSGIQQCKVIFHLVLPKWTGNKSVLQTAINKCMRQCDKRRFTSIAFPTVGTGQLLKYPLDVVLDCLISESKQTSQKSNCIKKIKFIVYDDIAVEKFREKLEGPSASGSGNQHNRRSKSYDQDDKEPNVREADKHKEDIAVVSVELCSVSKTEGEKLRSQLCKDIKDTFLYEEKYTNQRLKSISKDCRKKMFAAATKHHVWMNLDNEHLTLRGEKEAVLTTKNHVLDILLQDSGSEGGGHRNGGKSHDQASNYVKKYSPEWWHMQSFNDTQVPRYWKHFNHDGVIDSVKNFGKKVFLGKDGYLVDVDEKTKNLIISLINKTWNGSVVGQGKDARGLKHSKIFITRVQRIENYTLYDKYSSKKREFCNKLSKGKKCPALEKVASKGQVVSNGPVLTTQNINKFLIEDLDLVDHANEHYLFHGTPDQYVNNIINKGIDEKLGGEKAMFGAGIYGAESPTKADQYADDESNRQMKDRKMLLIRLLLGNMFVTSKPEKYRIPPCSRCLRKDCREDKHEPFDSVVADGSWLFREFIVYRNEQCYPEYLITYDRV